MGRWNYRIVKERFDDHFEYRVAEIYYDQHGTPILRSAEDYNPLSHCEDADEVRGTIEKIQAAARKPVLMVVGAKMVEVPE